MVISGKLFFNQKQWGDRTTTLDVNCGRSPTWVEATLNMTLDNLSRSRHQELCDAKHPRER